MSLESKKFVKAKVEMISGEEVEVQFEHPTSTVEGAFKAIMASRYFIKNDKVYLTNYVVSVEALEERK